MLSFPSSIKIYLSVDPCDMRKSYNGLFSLVEDHLKEDPNSGNLFLFTNKRRNRLKVLYSDGSGLWIMGKRLEQGRFSWPTGININDGKLKLNRRAMALLLEGIELKNGHQKAWYEE